MTANRSDARLPITGALVRLSGVVLMSALATGGAFAQGTPQPLPGVVVTTPQPAAPPAPVVVTRPPAPAPAPLVTTTTTTISTTTTTTAPPAAPVQAAPAPAAPKAKPKQQAAKPRPAPVGSPDAASSPGGGTGQAAVFVNDEPITAYQVEARARLLLLSSNIGEKASENMKRLVRSEETNQRWRKIVEDTVKENQGKSREQIMAILQQKQAGLAQSLQQQAVQGARASLVPGMRKQAKEDLVEEQIKLQEAKRLNIVVDDKEIDTVVRGLAERNKMNDQQFAAHLNSLGTDITAMKDRFRATLAWNEVVRRTFGHLINVSEREVDRFTAKAGKGAEQIDVKVMRIIVPLPAKADQRAIVEKLDAAERIRIGQKGCKTLAGEAAKHGGKVEDLGFKPVAAYPDSQRVMLANAQENELIPASITAAGVEILAVCQRNVTTATESKRQEALSDLKQREFEVRARGLLADLKAKADIVDRETAKSKTAVSVGKQAQQ